jgi:hypothetical protein
VRENDLICAPSPASTEEAPLASITADDRLLSAHLLVLWDELHLRVGGGGMIEQPGIPVTYQRKKPIAHSGGTARKGAVVSRRIVSGLPILAMSRWRGTLKRSTGALRRPEKVTTYADDVLQRLQDEHLACRVRLREAGHVVTNCPLSDQPDPALRGLTSGTPGGCRRCGRPRARRSAGAGVWRSGGRGR